MRDRDYELSAFYLIGSIALSLFLILLAFFFVPQESNAEDRVIVAKVIAGEACGEGEIGMQAVANVIANRSRVRKISPTEVVTQPHQFKAYTAPNRDILYKQCKTQADRLAYNLENLSDITSGALFFRSFGKLGHIFYKQGEAL